jgi:hypothetical protein
MGLRIAWLGIALYLTFYPSWTGDYSVGTGLVWLFWTFPFGLFWWTDFYPLIVAGFSEESVKSIQIAGQLLSVALAFVFWFVVVPWIFKKSRELQKRKK